MTHRIKTIQETFPVVGKDRVGTSGLHEWFSTKMNSSGTSCLSAVWKTLLPPTAGSQQWTEHLVLHIADPDRGESGFCFDDWGTGQDRFMVFKLVFCVFLAFFILFSDLHCVVGDVICLLNTHCFQQSSWHLISQVSAKGLQQTLASGWASFQSEALGNLPLFLVLPSEDYVSSSFYKDCSVPWEQAFCWICRRYWACSLFQPRERRLTSNPALLCDWLTGMMWASDFTGEWSCLSQGYF